MIARCDHVVKIPTKFSTNLAVAGALVMSIDSQLRRFAEAR